MYLVKVKIEQSELHVYISLLKQYKLLNTNNYEEIINKVKTNFNVDISIEELNEYYNPNLYELIEDSQLQYKHLGFM